MIRISLIALAVMSLSSCATNSVREDLPASDLVAYRESVRQTAQRQKLTNGREYCAELAATDQAQDKCMGDLEDALWRANQRITGLDALAERFVKRMELQFDPCNIFERMFRRDRCKIPGDTDK